MKKIILPNGDILFAKHIVKLSRISDTELYSFFTIYFIGGSVQIRSTKIDIRIKLNELISFVDYGSELTLNFEDR